MADKKKNNKLKIPNNTNIKSIYKSNNKTKTKKGKNPYKIIKKIGEGSYGLVYLIKMETNLSLCVLKKIDLKGLSKQEIKDTYKEVNLLKKLDHPNIIKFVEVNNNFKRYLEIITEYAEKGDLYNQICIQVKKKSHFPEKIIIDWLIQICQALKYIHSKHIIHRDIKPQNIFLSNKGCIKLGDFGVSKTLNNTMEKAKTFVGTAYYLPPEIIDGKKYSYTADIWSLGITFYQLMTFKMPFDGDSLPAIITKIATGADYAKINKKLYSKELINLVYDMMNIKPSKRPKANDILNMDFIKKRIQVYLKENQFDDILSKTIIKNYQVNYGFNKKNEDDNNSNDNNNAIIINNENTEKSIDLKNKLKFNKIIELIKEETKIEKKERNENKDIKSIKNIKDNNSNLKKDNISNNENNEDKRDKEKQKIFLGQILLNNENTNTKIDNKDNIIEKTKDKNENMIKNTSIERPKIKIKLITSQNNTKSNVNEQMNIKNNENNKKEDDKKENNKNENDKIENENNKIEKENNFDSTIKTNMTSYNPEDVKYGFETKYIENNMIIYGNGEKEITLEKKNDFIFETQKENEIRQNLKDEYDHQRNLILLNSIIMGKSDNDVENENELINHIESDIEENDEDNNDETY